MLILFLVEFIFKENIEKSEQTEGSYCCPNGFIFPESYKSPQSAEEKNSFTKRDE